jgi:polyhydroxybutyrate depolymerase
MNGVTQDRYYNLGAEAKKAGMIFMHPDGITDSFGNRFWKATEACCDHFQVGVDDSKYIMKLITDLEKKFKIDHKRIYLVGYSNGAFMANKFACDHSPLIAAVVSVSGAGNIDFAQCQAQPPVSFL